MVKALLKPNFLDMIYIYIYQNHTTKIHRETVDFVLLYMYILPPFQKVTIHDSVKHGPPASDWQCSSPQSYSHGPARAHVAMGVANCVHEGAVFFTL